MCVCVCVCVCVYITIAQPLRILSVCVTCVSGRMLSFSQPHLIISDVSNKHTFGYLQVMTHYDEVDQAQFLHPQSSA